jgi:hypothetical protein
MTDPDAHLPPEPLAETLAYLGSAEAEASLEADPYWPKWASPWWRMTLLCELGQARAIPERAVAAMTRVLRTHYLEDFPLDPAALPPGVDPYRHVACHCALGTIHQVLRAAGVDVDAELPWIRAWLLRYQLPDGGLNCDEAAYRRPVPHSSMVSTLPPLEAVLHGTPRPLAPAEERFLDRGAGYLIARRLCRSVSRGGALMDPAWLEPCFPRFYDYDVLRGLSFLTAWSERRGLPLPVAAIDEARTHLERRAGPGGQVVIGRCAWAGAWNLARDARGDWVPGVPAERFALLEETSRVGAVSPSLTREWQETSARLDRLAARGLLAV